MTKKKEMRIKEVGATINLGNYSALRVTIGEETEYAGLELQRATSYLQSIAASVGGILNLPGEKIDKQKAKQIAENIGEKSLPFASDISTNIIYDHTNHSYTTENGKQLLSVTQFIKQYYPMNDAIPQEYMDFAASFGNLVHTAIQNSVIGKAPKKAMVKQIIEDVLKEIGEFDEAWVEQFVVSIERGIAGRFDILTKHGSNHTLWDVKTNTDLFLPVECTLPDTAKDYLSEFWGTDTMYGEHCLQLNFYADMLNKAGIPTSEIKIIHVPDEFDQVYDVPQIDIDKFMGLLNG